MIDVEGIIDRVEQYGPQLALPVLITSGAEIIETCKAAGRDDLVERVRTCTLEQAREIARKLGDVLMDGGDYWEGIPVVVERVLGL